MNSAARWFPQWETCDADLSPGALPGDAARRPGFAHPPRFGYVSVWELAAALGEDSSATEDDAFRRAA